MDEMKKIYLIVLMMLAGCVPSQEEKDAIERENYAPVKPFVIYNKHMHSDNKGCWYSFYDDNKKKFDFEDYCDKYSIGDTIK